MVDRRRVAVITGGANGLGAEMARRFVQDGLAVVVTDTDAAAARLLALELGGSDVAMGIRLDVTSDEEVNKGIDTVGRTFGRIDVLINNAGILSRRAANETLTEDWHREVDVSLGGTMRCSRAAFPWLDRTEGACVINLGSVASTLGLPLRLAYSAAKTGILGVTRTLAAEWGPLGIRVNAIAPGYIDTELMRSGFTLGVLDEQQVLRRTPLGRLGQPREIASAAAFLASPDASFVNGVMLPVDGGITISGDFRV